MPMYPVVHFEIPTSDLKKSQAFYEKVFGWQMQPMDAENLMVQTTEAGPDQRPKDPGAINGSIYLRKAARTPNVVIDVPDIQKHVAIVREHGGKVVDEPVTIPGMGIYCRFQDPEGNLVGLWQTIS